MLSYGARGYIWHEFYEIVFQMKHESHTASGSTTTPPPPSPQNETHANFGDMTISNVLRDLLFGRNQPMKSGNNLVHLNNWKIKFKKFGKSWTNLKKIIRICDLNYVSRGARGYIWHEMYEIVFHHHHHHISVMEMDHLLIRSGLMYPEVTSKVCHDSFCQLGNSVSLP